MSASRSAYEHVRPSARSVRAAIALVAVVAVAWGLAAPASASAPSPQTAARSTPGPHPSPRPGPHRSPDAVKGQIRTRGPIGPGSVSGHVTFPPNSADNYENSTVFVRNQRVLRTVRVDRFGDYRADDLPDGSYRVVFNRLSGYATAAAQFYRGHDEYEGSRSADDVTVTGGAAVTGVDASLHEGGSIVGVLRNSAGNGLKFCRVQAYTRDGSLVTRDGQSNRDGAFEIDGLTTGGYLLRVLPRVGYSGAACDNRRQYVAIATGGQLGGPAQAVPVQVRQGRTTRLRPLVYAVGGQISGHVVLPSGVLDSDRFVIARNHHDRQMAPIDTNGDYTIQHLTPGSYRLTFDRLSGQALAAPLFYRHSFEDQSESGGIPVSFTRVSVSSAHTTSVRPASLAVGGTLAGVVTDAAGAPLEHCYVQAYTTDNRLVTRAGFTGADGSFAVGGLSTGSYLLRVLPRRTGGCNAHKQFYVGGRDLGGAGAAVPVPVTLGRRTTVGTLVFARGADISGHVTFGPGYSRYYDRSVTVRSGHRVRTVQVRRDDTYTVRGLPPGSYRVTFNRLSGFAVAAAQFYRGHDEYHGVASADRITVTAGQEVTGVDATLHAGGHLTGRLVDPSGQPLLDCQVQAFTPDGTLVTRDAYTDYPDGSFDIAGLTTGRYYLRVVPIGYRSERCDQGVQYLGAGTTTSNVGPGTPRSAKQGATRSVGTIVYGPRTPLVDTRAPSISGAPTVGSTLTADPGTWSPVAPTSYLYAWFADGTRIAGADASTYVVQDADLGHSLTVRVTARRPGLVPGTATSAPVGPVTGQQLTLTRPPAIVGRPVVGQASTVDPGAVTPTPTRTRYQWLRDGVPLARATRSRYTPTSADVGHRLSVQLTYSRAGYPDLVATTKALRVRDASG